MSACSSDFRKISEDLNSISVSASVNYEFLCDSIRTGKFFAVVDSFEVSDTPLIDCSGLIQCSSLITNDFFRLVLYDRIFYLNVLGFLVNVSFYISRDICSRPLKNWPEIPI